MYEETNEEKYGDNYIPFEEEDIERVKNATRSLNRDQELSHTENFGLNGEDTDETNSSSFPKFTEMPMENGISLKKYIGELATMEFVPLKEKVPGQKQDPGAQDFLRACMDVDSLTMGSGSMDALMSYFPLGELVIPACSSRTRGFSNSRESVRVGASGVFPKLGNQRMKNIPIGLFPNIVLCNISVQGIPFSLSMYHMGRDMIDTKSYFTAEEHSAILVCLNMAKLKPLTLFPDLEDWEQGNMCNLEIYQQRMSLIEPFNLMDNTGKYYTYHIGSVVAHTFLVLFEAAMKYFALNLVGSEQVSTMFAGPAFHGYYQDKEGRFRDLNLQDQRMISETCKDLYQGKHFRICAAGLKSYEGWECVGDESLTFEFVAGKPAIEQIEMYQEWKISSQKWLYAGVLEYFQLNIPGLLDPAQQHHAPRVVADFALSFHPSRNYSVVGNGEKMKKALKPINRQVAITSLGDEDLVDGFTERILNNGEVSSDTSSTFSNIQPLDLCRILRQHSNLRPSTYPLFLSGKYRGFHTGHTSCVPVRMKASSNTWAGLKKDRLVREMRNGSDPYTTSFPDLCEDEVELRQKASEYLEDCVLALVAPREMSDVNPNTLLYNIYCPETRSLECKATLNSKTRDKMGGMIQDCLHLFTSNETHLDSYRAAEKRVIKYLPKLKHCCETVIVQLDSIDRTSWRIEWSMVVSSKFNGLVKKKNSTSGGYDGEYIHFPFDIDELESTDIVKFLPIRNYLQSSLDCYSSCFQNCFTAGCESVDYSQYNKYWKTNVFVGVSMACEILKCGAPWKNVVCRSLASYLTPGKVMYFPPQVCLTRDQVLEHLQSTPTNEMNQNEPDVDDNYCISEEYEKYDLQDELYVNPNFLSAKINNKTAQYFLPKEFKNFMIDGMHDNKIGLTFANALKRSTRVKYAYSSAKMAIVDLLFIAGITGRNQGKFRINEEEGSPDALITILQNEEELPRRSIFEEVDTVGVGQLHSKCRKFLLQEMSNIVEVLDRITWILHKIFSSDKLTVEEKHDYNLNDFPVNLFAIDAHSLKYPQLKSVFVRTETNDHVLTKKEKDQNPIGSEGENMCLYPF